MGDGSGAWGGAAGWAGGGEVISCIPNQGVIVHESGFLVFDPGLSRVFSFRSSLVSKSGFSVSEFVFLFLNQVFQFPNQCF